MYKSVELRDEVELVDGTKTKILKLREPTRGDLKFASSFDDEVRQNDELVIRLSGISLESLDKIPLCDNDKLLDALEDLKAGNVDPKN